MRLRALLGPPLVLALIWAAAIWWPAQRAISSATEELDQSESQQLSLITDIGRLDGTSEQQSDLEDDIAVIARSIPSDPMIDTFLNTLALSAEASGVRVNLVSPTEILDATTSDPNRPVPPGMSAIAIVMEAEGSFADVMTFLSSIDDLPRLIVIDQIGMVAVDGATQLIVIDLGLRIFADNQGPQEPTQ